MKTQLAFMLLVACALPVSRLEAQCIPFSVPTPGVVTPGEIVDLRPGAVLIRDLVAEGTAPIVSPFDTYRSVVDLVFPVGRDQGHVNGSGQLTTPVGVLDYRIKGKVTGDPFTREFSWQISFLIQGGTGIFEGATGLASFSGTSDADSIEGITEGVLCLAGAG